METYFFNVLCASATVWIWFDIIVIKLVDLIKELEEER